jgi:NADH-quinone oxidoreductase subunit J
MIAENVAFGIIAAAMALGAIGVVRTKNVVHAALYLVVVLAGGAAQFILLGQEFVAWVQVLVYIGAVIVLFLFGIMLTRAQLGVERDLNNRYWGAAIPVALMLLVVLAWAILDAFDGQTMPDPGGPTPTQAIADNVLSNSLVPFLALSFILLAAAVGAIVLARKD